MNAKFKAVLSTFLVIVVALVALPVVAKEQPPRAGEDEETEVPGL